MDLNLTPEELTFREELRTWLASNVAMSTLMYERGSYGARLHLIFKRCITRLIELSRTIQRNGRPAAKDPLIRQKLAQCSAEIEIMRRRHVSSRANSLIGG
jgi:alkylation response protein AidB-like acyl-CoA dehydrogenase